MCDKATIIEILAEHGPCDIHRLTRLLHGRKCLVTFMQTHLREMIAESRVAVSMGYYAIATADGDFPIVALPSQAA